MQRSSRVSALGLLLSLLALAALARGTPRSSAESPPPQRAVAETSAVTGPIDLNTAGVEQLVTLPRIGPTLAARIVDDREAHGPFGSVDALDRVPGIGPHTIELIRPHAAVSAPLTDR